MIHKWVGWAVPEMNTKYVEYLPDTILMPNYYHITHTRYLYSISKKVYYLDYSTFYG